MNEQPPRVTRRRAVQIALVGGLVAAAGSAIAIVGAFLRPKAQVEPGAPRDAGRAQDFPRGGDPVHYADGKFWLANLDPSDQTSSGPAGGAGLLACSRACPHQGATVPWRPTWDVEGTKGWYRCPSHGATFTRAGVRVSGPAPRNMDTMRVTVDGDGAITVYTGNITRGDADNPKRAIQHPLLPS